MGRPTVRQCKSRRCPRSCWRRWPPRRCSSRFRRRSWRSAETSARRSAPSVRPARWPPASPSWPRWRSFGRIDALGVRRLLGVGSALAIVACAAVALAPTLALFLAAHLLVGLAFACLLSAGFAGVAAFAPDRRPWAIGYVAGANALAWIVVNPLVGAITEWLSWRAAQVVPAAVAVAALLTTRASRLEPHRPAARPLTELLREPSARRWLGAEVIAYGAWTAVLTFVGAFFIERLGVSAVLCRLDARGRGGRALHRFESQRNAGEP